MKLISFSMTPEQILDRSKTVTRRMGWKGLAPGTQLRAVEKAMGLKRGEKVRDLAVIEVVDVRRELIEDITAADVVAEGFPDWTAERFVEAFCKAMRCDPADECVRIEFRYVGDPTKPIQKQERLFEAGGAS